MTRGSRPGGGEGAERTALLAAARAGSQDAFRDLFTPDLDLAWRMALRITGSEASADELDQRREKGARWLTRIGARAGRR